MEQTIIGLILMIVVDVSFIVAVEGIATLVVRLYYYIKDRRS